MGIDTSAYGIHWFRRDLRVAGNPALISQFEKYNGRVVGVFCFDKKFLSRPDFSVNRFQFFINTLIDLRSEMRSIGSDLLFLDIGPEDAFKNLFDGMKQKNIRLPSTISCNKDYEPFSIKRDKKLKKLFHSYGFETEDHRDHLVIEPDELKKADGSGYQVYTPFARKWLEIFTTDRVQARILSQGSGIKYLKKTKKDKIFNLSWNDILKNKIEIVDSLYKYHEENLKLVDIELPKSGSYAAYKSVLAFKKKINDYGKCRDIPSLNGTSGLSIYLKNGSITTSQVIYLLNLEAYKKASTGPQKFLSELIWREFYYHIIYRCPDVEKKSFQSKYENLVWENNKKWFSAWKEGRTGFPIVDAGMRQLNTTGQMHNRVRMIVASFLTKDLLIDWRWGEKYFMDKLLDGDIAANNGGWQWAASTGCDAQPYFRVFNPWLQSKKFDPDGEYIKTYLPELANISPKDLHKPILGLPNYPEPIVDHKLQRVKAIQMYKINE